MGIREEIDFYLKRTASYYENESDLSSQRKAVELLTEAITRIERIGDFQLLSRTLLSRGWCQRNLYWMKEDINLSELKSDIKKALHSNPNYEHGWELLGWVNFELNESLEAIESYSIAIELYPDVRRQSIWELKVQKIRETFTPHSQLYTNSLLVHLPT